MEIIIVLGNRNEKIMKTRVNRAIEEFNSTPATHLLDNGQEIIDKYILFTGGSSDGVSKPTGAELMEEYAATQLDRKFLRTETLSKSTIENIQNTRQLLDATFSTTIDYKPTLIICTSTFHIKRALILSRLFLDRYPRLRFIHTNESITTEEYQREAQLLNNFIDQYCMDVYDISTVAN